MDTLGKLIDELRAGNHRLTIIRKAILSLLLKVREPLSPADILGLLEKSKILANKTTIYRELDFLKKQDMIRELQLGDTAKYYEIKSGNHHHHVICVKCDKVEDVVLEKDLDLQEKSIAKSKKFKILNHSLEFYGVCKGCQPNYKSL